MVRRIRRILVGGIVGLLGLCGVLVGISALSNLGMPTRSQIVDRLSPLDKARLAEAIHLRCTLGDAVWAGWGQSDIPVILYNEEYAFLIGYPNPPPGWFKVPNHIARGGPWEPVPDDAFEGNTYYRQRLSDSDKTPQAFAVLVGDRWVASLGTKEWMNISLAKKFRQDFGPIFPYRFVTKLFIGNTDKYISALLHESFHAFEGTAVAARLEAAEEAVGLQEANYPWDDTAFQNAWQMELNTLAKAVQTTSQSEARGMTSQFLNQREQRRRANGLSPSLVEYERQREWLEGLSKYVELAIWQQAATSPDYEPVPTLADDRDFKRYADFDQQWSQEVAQIRRMAKGQGDVRFYYSGMAQGFLLDRLVPNWKSRILTEDISLEELLWMAVQQSAG